MCCSGPTWKREVVPEHKFDFIDTRDYRENSFWTSLRYLWLYLLVIKSFLIYVSDVFTAVTMLSTNNWTNSIYSKCNNNCVIPVDFDIAKWVFVGCIIFGFLLVAYEARKARKIIASRDISYAFTNVMANNYYSLRSYDHFCFFSLIESSTTKKDDFAFFIFFTFKGWKRLLLADGPRQAVNAIVLYSFASANGFSTNLKLYYGTSILTAGLLVSMLFTVLMFAGSLILLIAAGILYLPLLCYIRGNLKEYCCHKVDKRITELVKRKARQRVAQQAALARKEAAGDFSHLKSKRGDGRVKPLPQPTLPNLSVEDEYNGRGGYAAEARRWSDYKGTVSPEYPPVPGIEYPPVMPGYDGYPPYTSSQPPQPQQYMQHNPYPQQQYASYPTPSTEESGFDVESEYGSTAHLTHAAAPIGYSDSRVSQTSLPPAHPQQQSMYLSAGGEGRTRPGSGLIYDEEPDYLSYCHEDEAAVQGHGRSRSAASGGRGGGYAM